MTFEGTPTCLPAACAGGRQNFCGVDGNDFRQNRLDRLGPQSDILPHLKGCAHARTPFLPRSSHARGDTAAHTAPLPLCRYVRPHDVVALMTVLPQFKLLFSTQPTVINGTEHRLYLTEESLVDAAEVTNLLRDTYHEVVLMTVGSSRRVPERKLRKQSVRWRRAPSEDGSAETLVIPQRNGGALQKAAIVKVLKSALRQAHSRVERVSTRAGIGAVVAGVLAMAVFLIAWSPLVPTTHDIQITIGDVALYVVGLGIAATSLGAAVQPVAGHATRVRAFAALLPSMHLCIMGGLAVFMAWRSDRATEDGVEGVDLLDNAFIETYVPDRPYIGYIRVSIILVCLVIAYYLAPLIPLATILATARRWPEGVATVHSALLVYVGLANASSAVHNATYLVVDLHFNGLYAIWDGFGRVVEVAAWFSPVRAIIIVIMCLFAWMQLTEVGRAFLRARVARTFAAPGPTACIAPLVGFGSLQGVPDPTKLVDEALAAFEPVVLDAMARERVLQYLVARDPLQRARQGLRPMWACITLASVNEALGEMEGKDHLEGATSAAEPADAFVVHSPMDAAVDRASAIVRWAEAFEAAHGRPPRVWLDAMCQDMSLSPEDVLSHLPCYLLRSQQLLLIAGPRLSESLSAMVQLFTWRVVGGRLDEVAVAVASAPGDMDHTVATLDTFHIMYARLRGAGLAFARIRGVVELATAPVFNSTVHDYVALINNARMAPPRDSPRSAPRGHMRRSLTSGAESTSSFAPSTSKSSMLLGSLAGSLVRGNDGASAQEGGHGESAPGDVRVVVVGPSAAAVSEVEEGDDAGNVPRRGRVGRLLMTL